MSAIRSEMAATVWKVEMAEGESVSPGDVIMILESMKMEIPIIAEDAGTISNIAVAPGDSVDEDQVLAQID